MPKLKANEEMYFLSTIQIVAEAGLENLRTKDVALRTGFSEATLFRYFESKDQLLISTFTYVDRKLSDVFLNHLSYIAQAEVENFNEYLHLAWHDIFRYLIDNPDETIFLIRFRYSAMYTDEVRSLRQAYNGNFEEAYALFEKYFGKPRHTYRGFLINYIFEITLCFAEKVITGKLENTFESENNIWIAVQAAISGVNHTHG